MIRFRKWNVYPPIFSNDGKIISELEVTGKLIINDNDDVFTNVPSENQVLVWKVTQNADGSTDQRWENENISTIIPSVGLIDEIRMFGGDVVSTFPSGEGIGEYEGWYLCDGDNGTLDLRSRFVLGLGPGQYTDTIGFEGGVSEVTLSGEESGIQEHDHSGAQADGSTLYVGTSGSHSHSYFNYRGNSAETGNASKVLGTTNRTTGASSHSHPAQYFGGRIAKIDSTNALEAHTNIPPYTIVAYIQFKG